MKYIYIWISLFISAGLYAQPVVLDEIIAVVGPEIILRSDVESQLAQLELESTRNKDRKPSRCEILEDLMIRKMLVFQAELDSVELSKGEIDAEVERRVMMLTMQVGSREKLEKMMGRSTEKLTEDLRSSVREQMLIQRVQGSVLGNITVTPGEVKKFFEAIPKDSLPLIPAETQLAQIVIKPVVRQEEKDKIIARLRKIREEIQGGGSFCLKAKFNSIDKGSAPNCGELGFVRREDLVPEFAAVAFALKPGEISDVVASPYGYHIIELVEKRGEYANFRHILLRPEITVEDLEKAEVRLMEALRKLDSDSITFYDIAKMYSEDEDTKYGGGLLYNMQAASPYFMDEELEPETLQAIQGLKEGQVSAPLIQDASTGTPELIVFQVVRRTEPHQAGLTSDYSRLQAAAINKKRQDLLKSWVMKKRKSMYFRIDGYLDECPQFNEWNQTK
jgi:peptidyl-prolyl cis-trans isomerase SurA